MPSYRALIEGRNFLVNVDGRTRLHGFYQTIFVQAENPTDAESAALQAVKDDAQLKQMTKNDRSDPPMLLLDSLYELEASEPQPTATGRTYYVEKHWWQFWR